MFSSFLRPARIPQNTVCIIAASKNCVWEEGYLLLITFLVLILKN